MSRITSISRRIHRLADQMLGRENKRGRIIFMHVPKTGGTSLDRALGALYPRGGETNLSFNAVTSAWRLAQSYREPDADKLPSWFQIINTVLCYKIARQTAYLSGHFAVTRELLEAARHDYRFVTLLRDPVARWRSNYIYSRIRKTQDGEREVPADLGAELDRFIASPTGAREGAKYVRYLGGFNHRNGLRDPGTIEAASELLAQFDVVGILENLEPFQRRLSLLVGSEMRVPHERRTQTIREPGGHDYATYRELFTPARLDRIRELCEPDHSVYRFGQSLSGDPRQGA